jgi:prepilin-type N-terminal cleavage/methylation domain-containing protein
MKRGFTLIEVMVVVSIMSLLSSIVFAGVNLGRQKAQAAQTVIHTKQLQNAFAITSFDTVTFPDPGSTSAYYCIGKDSSDYCIFWGAYSPGSTVIKNAIAPAIASEAITVPRVYIDGLPYEGIVYKCTERGDGVCKEGAVYWAEARKTECTMGLVVILGAGGVVCGQNIASTDTDNVESMYGLQPVRDFTMTNYGTHAEVTFGYMHSFTAVKEVFEYEFSNDNINWQTWEFNLGNSYTQGTIGFSYYSNPNPVYVRVRMLRYDQNNVVIEQTPYQTATVPPIP